MSRLQAAVDLEVAEYRVEATRSSSRFRTLAPRSAFTDAYSVVTDVSI